MGSIIQQGLRQLGISEETIKQCFQTHDDKIQTAIALGDVELLQQLSKQYNYDFTSIYKGENSLMLATKLNQYFCAEYILQATPKEQHFKLLEDKNPLGDSSLMIAVINQNVEIAQLLINNEAKVNTKEVGGCNIFIAACASGNLELVQWVMKLKGLNFYHRNNDGQTALHRASFYGEIDIVRYLLKNTKFSFLSKDKLGNNCFHLAAQQMHLQLIRYMLKKFKKTTVILSLPNAESLTALQMLIINFNQIKSEKYPDISEQEVLAYITNKELPPNMSDDTKQAREQYDHKQKLQSQPKSKKKTLLQRLRK